jgi:predicted transcriptional regulator
MSQSLTITLPDDIHSRLVDLSRRQGKSPESVAQTWVSEAVRQAQGDSLRRWAGAFESGVPDAAEQHDDHLGTTLRRELTGDADD